jgi:hypothetical protein
VLLWGKRRERIQDGEGALLLKPWQQRLLGFISSSAEKNTVRPAGKS